MKKIIHDCDTGIDDALAILLSIKSKKLDIIGISTVAGNSSVINSTHNTLRVLRLLGSDIPVYKGADHPLNYDLIEAGHVHGKDGMGDSSLPLIGEDDLLTSIKKESACEFIIESSLKYKGLTIVTTGPLTNLALAILSGDLRKENIEEVIVMGGAINRPGNITKSAEFNIYVDPHSANVVFKSGLPITLVPLDITHEVILTPKFLEKRFPDTGEVSRFVKEIIKHYNKFYINIGEKGCPLHDPLAMGICIDKNFVTEFQPMKVYIGEEFESYLHEGRISLPSEELIRGQTIVERIKGEVAGELDTNANVCLKVNSEKFLDFFAKTLTEF